MTLVGYEDYQIFWISSSFFNKTSYYDSDFITTGPWRDKSKTLYRLPGTEPIYRKLTQWHHRGQSPLRTCPEFTEKLYTPKDGDALYFDKACTIPRIKCEGKWKRVINLIRSQVVVIPEPAQLEYETVAIFADSLHKKLWIMQSPNNLTFKPMIGHTIGDLLEFHKNNGTLSKKYYSDAPTMVSITEATPAKCIFVGDAIKYYDKDQFIWNVIEGVYPRIIFENDLLNLLGSDEDKMDAEFIQSLIDLLLSKDRESVHQGMRVLAELDYAHYPSVSRYILRETQDNWERFKPFNSAVKFMLQKLDYRTRGFRHPFDRVTPEEFAIAKGLMEEIIRVRVAKQLQEIQRETNMTLSTSFDVVLSLNQTSSNTSEEDPDDYDDYTENEGDGLNSMPTMLLSQESTVTEEECPDCPKASEIDFSFINSSN